VNSTTFTRHILPIRDKLYRFAFRLTGNTHEAEDVVQDVMEKLLKNTETTPIQNWEAWCMTLVKNRSLSQNKYWSIRRTSDLQQVSELPSQQEDHSKTTENQDLVALIRQKMQALPEKQRLVFHLRDVEGLSYEEISTVLDLSLDQVKTNLHRARKMLRLVMRDA
jgi:RNA polymerase sigma factor (sigma-70 family)